MSADAGFLGRLGPSLVGLLPMLDERSRRLVLGMAARAAGDGGTGAVAALTGAAWQTVADGKAELESGEPAPPGRVRRPGGGRKRLEDADPGLADALEALIRDSSRGDPESPLTWTTRSVKKLAGELTGQGHRCSPAGCWLALRRAGYTLQSNAKAAEGRQHPERDAQFRYIAAQAREHQAAGQPVISVDAKKKEQVGNYRQAGRDWGPAGSPVVVRSHDFPDPAGQQHAIPYGIYDEQAGAGFVNVGTDGNTAALAVESIRRWWHLVGKDAYPDAARLLVTADAGGSNGYKNRAWKAGLAALAQETGLEITVCHFPPGTSKWNKIEHRLFCQISLAWRGRPLTSYDVIINTIGAVRTATGLTAAAVLDQGTYPTGAEISDKQMKDIEDRCLTRHDFHGEWNYTLLAVPRPAPGPEPPPAPAWRCDQQTLNHPALTGIDPRALTGLAAALEIPFAVHREQRRYQRSGRSRQRAEGGGGHNRKLDLTDHLLATLMCRHLNLPAHVIATVLGADRSTISRATNLTGTLLAAGIPLPPAVPPPAIPIRTLADLREYAARHGITITSPPPAPPLPQKPQ
jgi:Rhodopirellula transposase DDE domain